MRRKARVFSDVKISSGLIRHLFLLCGSNSWVIAPKKTKKRKSDICILVFGTWYEAHIVTPEFELYCYLAGTPFLY
jgi:hypothetical protein